MGRAALYGMLQRFYRMRRNGYSGAFFVAFAQFTMGVWLLVVPGTFVSSPAYSMMAEMAAQTAWGMFLLLTSLFMLTSSFNRRPRDVALGAVPAFLGFFFIGISLVLGNPRSMFIPVCFVLALRCLAINREFLANQDDPHYSHPERSKAPEERKPD